MPRKTEIRKRQAGGKAVVYGAFSVILYAALFVNEEFVRNTWAKGGAYAILPIVTVFVFSFIHGNFANHLMTSLGVVAKKR